MAISGTDWLEVPTIYKAYFSDLCKGIYPQNMAQNMVQYLHFRILKFPPLRRQSAGGLGDSKSPEAEKLRGTR